MNARRLLVATAGVLSAVALAAAATAVADEELRIEAVDARDFPEVTVIVTPPAALLGIEPEEVVVIENGVSRPATVRLLTDAPLEILLALDTSGSMRGTPLAAAKEAAAAFVASMPPTTRFAVMGFSSTPEVSGEFSEDPAVALAAIAGLQATGETALYDAVIAAPGAFGDEGAARRFIVLLSDGGDTASEGTLEDAVDTLEDSELGLYAIELQTAESDPYALERLTSISAGRVVPAEDAAALAEVFDLIASELVNQLAVRYTTGTGGPVELTIAISDPRGSAAGTASIVLPVTTPPITTTTAPPPTTTSAPPPATVPPPDGSVGITVTSAEPAIRGAPGLLGRRWVLPFGVAGVFVAAIVILGMAFVPAETRRTPLRERTGRFQSAGGLLGRTASGIQRGIDAMLTRFGRSASLNTVLDSAGVKLAAGEFIILAGAAGVVGVAVGLALFGFLGAAVLGVITLVAPRLVVARLREKRRTGFGDQLESTLQLLAGSLRAGYGLLQSIGTVASEAPSPSKEEFGRVMVETRVGRDLGDSLRALAERMENEDFVWVTQAIEIQRSVGGDLAEILDTVAQTIRERNQIRRQVRALSAEGRFSAYILIGLPFLVAAFLLMVIPEFLKPLVETTPGRIALVVAVVLLGVGVVWIRRLIKIVF